ncbi:hypothetical protein F5B22DRAFT_3609 [Xylaria bambusicola]|uniref:uncharacterized protein n=1 Tax=Xylaria bambusicola TaxID=326684 RepID=UPI0020082FA2|nr:uncharacterized protein F5B22DRAFT_3609 [Xylaria bambusicola]KAI0527776.1 hypothetical protein F5B22DRAFT_3609 [Xylaria bambusicola]
MASPGTPKTMSSRLLTMKFMQRAAASSPASTPSTPPSQDESNKRRKVAHNDTPPQNVDTLVNQAAIRAAIAEEEKKVESAIIKRAEELGDARWVLDIPSQKKGHPAPAPLKVVQVGFADIDSFDATENDVDEANTSYDSVPALRRYNMDKKKILKKSHNHSSDSSDGSDSDSESDSEELSSEETTGRQSFGSQSRNGSMAQSTARATLKSKKSAEQLKAMQFAERRRKKEVKLNKPKGGISSISSGGGPSPRQPVSLTCFRCNQPGHRAVDCKKPGSRQAR